MKIVVAGPATLSVLGLTTDVPGYPFPLISNLALEYHKQGHEVHVVTTSPGLERPITMDGHNGIKVHIVGSRPRARDRALDLFRIEKRQLKRIIEEIAPTVIHAHWTYEFALASQKLKVPLLITVHDWAPAVLRHFRDPYRVARLIMQVICLSRAVDTTAPSRYVARKVERTYRTECRVIANGVPVERFAAQSHNSSQGHEFRVGMLNSQNDPRKNVEAALSAWPYFLEKYPDSVLILAGEDFSNEGPLAKQQRFAQLESVQFIGSIPARSVSSWMHSLDVFLHPSLEESFGMVLVEAMQGSAVVIAGSSSGAVPEVVENAGYLVDVTDPRHIAAALVHLRDEPGLADEFRRRASDRIVEFSLPVIASQYLSVMDEIVQRSTSGRKASHRVRGRKISARYEG